MLKMAHRPRYRDITQPPVQHIILLISDGMGDAEINAVRNYPKGAGGFFSSTNQT